MINSINSLTIASREQSGKVSLPMQALFPLEQNTSAVANRSFQENSLSSSQTPLRNVVHLSDEKKSGDMGFGLILLIVFLCILGMLGLVSPLIC